MATVITVPGWGCAGIYPAGFFSASKLFKRPNIRVEKPRGGWSNNLTNNSAVKDTDSLYALIVEHQPQTDWLVVAGHSRGAQIIYKLFRDRMTDLLANVDPARILFISSGNPERKYGGACVIDPKKDPPIYPGKGGYGVGYGLPPDGSGPFPLQDIALQYDEWADLPEGDDKKAVKEARAGNAHADYGKCLALDARGYPADLAKWQIQAVEGAVKYLKSPWPR